MQSGGHRTFSFEAHDDTNSFQYTHLGGEPPYNPHHLFAPKQQQQQQQRQQQQQQYLSPASPEPQYRSASTAWDHPPPDDTDMSSEDESGGMEHQPTVIRRSIPPASAAAAAAALQVVQEDLTPTRERAGFWGPETDLSPTPASQAPLLPPTATTTPRGLEASPRRGVLVDPLLGQYSDNPYKRMSTTWDPAVTQSGFDGAADVLSDDEEQGRRGGKKAALAVGGAGGGAMAVTAVTVIGAPGEKSEWLRSTEKSNRKSRWIIGAIALLVILGIVAGAVVGTLLAKKKSSSSSAVGGGGGLTGAEDTKINGDLNKDSPEIQALMNNPNLHRVFHGMDYTPLNAMYPDCITNPPTQNNITRDMAVLSLLTDKIRLYGNDCNQTELVLHAIDALQINMTVWAGVWLDNNQTTNTRQLNHLYTLLADSKNRDKFAGVAVGNEVLFAKTLTETQLFDVIDGVRSNLTSLGYNLPVGTSDLGSNWNADMAAKVDVLMANVHPFFAGVVVEKAANWTWTFFQENDVVLTDNLAKKPRVMISEVGWPSGGGSDEGSVAGIDQMNRFMADFVCQSNAKGMEYFWFEGFDEPWKIKYNTPGKQWEDKWGLLDVNRKLKDGLKIPTC